MNVCLAFLLSAMVFSRMGWILHNQWKRFACCGIIFFLAFTGCVPVRNASDKRPLNSLSVMTYNIWDLNGKPPDLESVADVIRSEGGPDLVLLQEVRGKNMAIALSKALHLPYHLYLEFHGANFGVAILTRYPFAESGFLYLKTSKKGRGVLMADVIAHGRTVRVYSIHLDRIENIAFKDGGVEITWGDALKLLTREISEETVRSRSVEELLEWIGSRGTGSVIIGGDFNTVVYSTAIRRMSAVFEDALWGSGDYFTGSYAKSTLPVDPRLDFLFHSPDMQCREASVIRKSAGDHYPVRAVFVF